MKGFYKYIVAKAKEINDTVSYRAYMTDVLRAIAKSKGIDVSERWYDLVRNGPVENEAEAALNNFYSDLRR